MPWKSKAAKQAYQKRYRASHPRQRRIPDQDGVIWPKGYHPNSLKNLEKFWGIQRQRERPRKLEPLPEHWPYGATGWPIEEVDQAVSKTLWEEFRADVCQELCLKLLSKEITRISPQDIRRAIRKSWSEYTLSLDIILTKENLEEKFE